MFSNGHTNVDWPVKTYIHQFYADTGCPHSDFPKRVKESVLLTWRNDDNIMMDCVISLLLFILIMKKILQSMKDNIMKERKNILPPMITTH